MTSICLLEKAGLGRDIYGYLFDRGTAVGTSFGLTVHNYT